MVTRCAFNAGLGATEISQNAQANEYRGHYGDDGFKNSRSDRLLTGLALPPSRPAAQVDAPADRADGHAGWEV